MANQRLDSICCKLRENRVYVKAIPSLRLKIKELMNNPTGGDGYNRVEMLLEPPLPLHTSVDASNRLPLPKYLSDCVSWIQGSLTLNAWILLVAPGRYRLLSDDEVQRSPMLEPVRTLLTEGTVQTEGEPTFAQDSTRAAIVARLLPAIVAPHKPGWRISFPRSFNVFAPPGCDTNKYSILMSLEGYLEIWYTDVLTKAASGDIDPR